MITFFSSLVVALYTAFVVGAAMTAIATGGIEFTFYLVHGHEVAAMLHLTVGTIAELCGWFNLDFVGMTVIAEGAFVAGTAESVIRGSIKAVTFDKNG